MKKFFILFVVIFLAVNANAQWFLGGSIGFNVNVEGSKDSESFTPYKSEIGFTVAPKLGYYFNEKLALGIDLAIGPKFVNGTRTVIFYPPYGYPSEKQVSYQGTFVHWRATPFLRYSVFTYKKFALMLEGSVGVGGEHATLEFENNLTEKSATIGIGILNIKPVLGFKLTDHLQFEAVLNFLNIGYNLDINIMGEGVDKNTDLKHDLNIGFNAKSILVMSQLTIGMIYKF